jgi:hypothetical protein
MTTDKPKITPAMARVLARMNDGWTLVFPDYRRNGEVTNGTISETVTYATLDRLTKAGLVTFAGQDRPWRRLYKLVGEDHP